MGGEAFFYIRQTMVSLRRLLPDRSLWFASGSLANWDANALTYTAGENSVRVSGITADRGTLKFGDDGATQFAALTSAGAFLDATSERIFEESGKGILARLWQKACLPPSSNMQKCSLAGFERE